MVYMTPKKVSCFQYFEVDSTESVWYSCGCFVGLIFMILKLTPQSQYGITVRSLHLACITF